MSSSKGPGVVIFQFRGLEPSRVEFACLPSHIPSEVNWELKIGRNRKCLFVLKTAGLRSGDPLQAGVKVKQYYKLNGWVCDTPPHLKLSPSHWDTLIHGVINR